MTVRFGCIIFGHKPGSRLYRYPKIEKAISQRPDLRGRVGMVDVGYECARCLKRVELDP